MLEQQIILEERVIKKEGDFWATDANKEYVANIERITNSTIGFDSTPLTSKEKDGSKKRWNWVNTLLLLIGLYVFGLVVYWIRYFWQFASLLLVIHQGKRINIEGLPKRVHAITHPEMKTPCSWMRWMILNPSDTSTRAIIDHELAHIRLGHSWDMLLCEFTCRMLWCVPFAWMLRQDLCDVHEYQADRRVLATGIKDKEYQLLLIRNATDTRLQPVVNALNQSPIKRRFKMMYRKPSRRWAALKAAYLLPLSILALVAFARPQAMDEIEKQLKKAEVQLVEAADHIGRKGDMAILWQETEDLMSPTIEPPATVSALSTDSVIMFGNAYIVLENANVPDAVQEERTPVEVLDSTMTAIGARRIGEGIYVGKFKPNYTNDTIRVQRVSLCNSENQPTA